MVSTGYMPKMLTARAAAAAARCDFASRTVLMNDLSIVDGVAVVDGDAVVESLAAAPPRGGNAITAEVATAAVVRDGRFIGWNGEHTLVAHDIWMERNDKKRIKVARAMRLGLWC